MIGDIVVGAGDDEPGILGGIGHLRLVAEHLQHLQRLPAVELGTDPVLEITIFPYYLRISAAGLQDQYRFLLNFLTPGRDKQKITQHISGEQVFPGQPFVQPASEPLPEEKGADHGRISVELEAQTEKEVIWIPELDVAAGAGTELGFADEKTIKTLEDNDRIAFKYCNEKGEIDEESNPNGSINNIAGIFSEDKKILGMMPHPENSILDYQANQNGKSLFEGILKEIA